MAAIFCLRLALGMIAALIVLPTSLVHPRFFRVQYLTSLGMLAIAGFFLVDQANVLLWFLIGLGMGLCLVGSIVWHVEGHPGQKVVLFLSAATLMACLIFGGQAVRAGSHNLPAISDDVASALVLGAATSAMLMGHSYLLAPGMSIAPLLRLLGLLGFCLLVRVVLAGIGLWAWTGTPAGGTLENETLLWLGARWIIGFVLPLALTWMAWETARIRSTQSATGILYVVVIMCFLGELTSQLLLAKLHSIV